MKGFSTFLYEGMKGLGSWNQLLKIYSYLKTCPTRFPGAQTASLYPELFQEVLIWLFAIPWTAAPQASLSLTISQSLLKFVSIDSVMPSNHLILCHTLFLPSIFPSIRVFSNESALHRQSIGASASASVLPMNIQDWFPWGLTGDLLAVQGTLKSLLQHRSSKASILWRSWQVPICSWQSKEMSRPGSKAGRIPVGALGWIHFSFCFASSSDLSFTHWSLFPQVTLPAAFLVNLSLCWLNIDLS